MQCRTIHSELYYRLLEIPLCLSIYAICVCATAWLLLSDCISEQHIWALLLLVNVAGSVAWTVWFALRYGKDLAVVFLLLPGVCSIYACISVALLGAGLDIYPFPDAAVRRGMLLQSLTATHMWFFMGLLFSREQARLFRERVLQWLSNIRVSRTGVSLLVVVGIALAVVYVLNYHISGAAAIVQEGGGREVLLDTVETGKIWLVTVAFVCWCMTCVTLLLSPQARRSVTRFHICCMLGALGLFMSAFARLGNRREMLTGLLFICVLLCLKARTRLVALAMAVIAAISLYIGIARAFKPDARSQIETTTFCLNLLGEAIFPNFPLLNHISVNHQPWLGASYLRLPGYVLPSFGIWRKEKSLSEEFADQYGRGGMAYTPLGEGYANFGSAAVVVVPFFLACLGRLLFTTANRSRMIVPGIIFLALALDINRGEFVSIATEIVLYSSVIGFYMWLCRPGHLCRLLSK